MVWDRERGSLRTLSAHAIRCDGSDLGASFNLGVQWKADARKLNLREERMALIRDDRQAHFQFLEREELLYQNTDTWMPCPGSIGFGPDLPEPADKGDDVRLKDCWVWVESRESAHRSPKMCREFFLPYIAEVARPFGLACWACCEGLHARFPYIGRAIPHQRAVGVSGWVDLL